MANLVKRVLKPLYPILSPCIWVTHKLVITPLNIFKNSSKPRRMLEIGPGPTRIHGFETLNIKAALNVDYVVNASKHLPFPAGTFDLIYASHVLEHISWYQVQDVLREWVRVLKPRGQLEIWIPNGLLIAKTFVDAETIGKNEIHQDGWYRLNPEYDTCVWANGRIFSYGDGDGRKGSPNWHMSLFSPRYLHLIMERAGLVTIERLDRAEVRSHDHGWINLGFRGTKS